MYTLALATILASFHYFQTAPRSPFAGRYSIAVPNDLALRRRFLQCHETSGGRNTNLECSDGRLKLIDGHLRRDLDPEMEVDVEVLDVTEEEARKLLLTIDPLAGLAETQEQLHQRLLEMTPTDNDALAAAWEAAAAEVLNRDPEPLGAISEQFLILVTCLDEKQQVELLGRFGAEGLECRAMMG